MSVPSARSVRTLADVRKLVRLYARVWPGSLGLMDLLSSDGDCVLLVDTADRLLGYAFTETDLRRGFTEVQDIAVDPDHRRRGLGQALLDELKRRHARIKLIADSTRPELLRFYEKAGFRSEAVLENYYSIGRDGVRMAWSRRPDGHDTPSIFPSP